MPDDADFPCALTISTPLPSHRLARIALRALQVDAELSPLVKRSFSLTRPAHRDSSSNGIHISNSSSSSNGDDVTAATTTSLHDRASASPSSETKNGPPLTSLSYEETSDESTVLKTEYKATTNRMLRVAVNGFMESLGVVIGIMEELDEDVLDAGEEGPQG